MAGTDRATPLTRTPTATSTVVDRVKDMIVTGGENVYSTEVENAVHRHPSVLECAVFGVPDERCGELVHAAIVLKPDTEVDETEIVDHCRTLIAGYKLPRSIDFHNEPLPKSGAGKILKRELREPYWAGRERQSPNSRTAAPRKEIHPMFDPADRARAFVGLRPVRLGR
jgi:acyl-CoA synthetase (AMP-forming)/AMP-acid ligase II